MNKDTAKLQILIGQVFRIQNGIVLFWLYAVTKFILNNKLYEIPISLIYFVINIRFNMNAQIKSKYFSSSK